MGVAVRRARLLTMISARRCSAPSSRPSAARSRSSASRCRICAAGCSGTSDHRVLVPAVVSCMGAIVALLAQIVSLAARQRRCPAAQRRDVADRRAGRRGRAAAQPPREQWRHDATTLYARRDLAVGYRSRAQPPRGARARQSSSGARRSRSACSDRTGSASRRCCGRSRACSRRCGARSSSAATISQSMTQAELARRLGVVLTERVAGRRACRRGASSSSGAIRIQAGCGRLADRDRRGRRLGD